MSVLDEVKCRRLLDKGVELASRQVELCGHSLGRLRAKLDTLQSGSRSASIKVEHVHSFGLNVPLEYRVAVRQNTGWEGQEVIGWLRSGAFLPAIEELLANFSQEKEFKISLKMFGEYMLRPYYVIDILLFEKDDYVVTLCIDLRPTYMNAGKQSWLVADFVGAIADRLRDLFKFDVDYGSVARMAVILMKRLEAPEAKGRIELELSHSTDQNRFAKLEFDHTQPGWMTLQGVSVDGGGFSIAMINAINSLLNPRFDIGKQRWV